MPGDGGRGNEELSLDEFEVFFGDDEKALKTREKVVIVQHCESAQRHQIVHFKMESVTFILCQFYLYFKKEYLMEN